MSVEKLKRRAIKLARLAATNKCLAQSNKSSGRSETTNGATDRSEPVMSNILNGIDLVDRAIRRAVLAMFDAAGHRANRNGRKRLLRMQKRDKRQVGEYIGGLS
jgi:hypothetical protein